MTPTHKNTVLGGLLVGVALVNYGFHRVRPAWDELSALHAERDALETRLTELEAGVDPQGLAHLTRRVDALSADLAATRERLTAAKTRWARDDQAPDLAWQLAALAQESRLRIDAEELARPGPKRAADEPAPSLTALLQREPYLRPIHVYTISGRFGDLWRFLDRLEDLPWEALVLDMELTRPQHIEHRELPLQIKLVMAL